LGQKKIRKMEAAGSSATLTTIIYNSKHMTLHRRREQSLARIQVQGLAHNHTVGRRRGSHIFLTIGSQMAVRVSALAPAHLTPPGKFLVLISVRGWVDPTAIVRLEGLAQSNYATGCTQGTFLIKCIEGKIPELN
jgi:hypothetical protein